MKERLKGIVKSFTGIIVGASLLPSIGSGVAAVGGAAGRIVRPVPALFSLGIVGHAAKGAKKIIKW